MHGHTAVTSDLHSACLLPIQGLGEVRDEAASLLVLRPTRNNEHGRRALDDQNKVASVSASCSAY